LTISSCWREAPESGIKKFPVFFYRAFPYQYMIVYRQEKTGVEIVGVLHAKRDFKRILKQRK
jgi:plasmid stabilization system protein ParE